MGVCSVGMKRKHRGRKTRWLLLEEDRWIAPIIYWFECLMAKIEGLQWDRSVQEEMHIYRAKKWQQRIKKGVVANEKV